MPKTILITGSSTGIGKATAKLFAEHGWNVIATMRNPSKETELTQFKNVFILPLDVTDSQSIQMAIQKGIEHFGKIDVLVNNAGFGLMGVFEGMSMEQIKNQFATNVFGLMEVSKAILPHFRENQAGTIINISSIAGLVAFPLFSIYHASKWAVEGYSESLQYELADLNIRVKLVEPAAIKTDFYDRSADKSIQNLPNVYERFLKITMQKTEEAGETGAPPLKVAKVIFKAANDQSKKLRYPVGIDAASLLILRKLIPNRIFTFIVKTVMGI